MSPVRIIFLGTPAFAAASLSRLLDAHHQIAGVVTQPDRRRGRGQHVTQEAVKTLAVSRGLTVLQPERWKDPALAASLRGLKADLAVVAAYGRILPQWLLELPRLGVINVHASLLPRWRGAAPVHRAVIAGDARTGVTIMRVVLALDAGPMLAQAPTDISPDETSEELERRLAAIGADLLVSTVARMTSGPIREEPQNEAAATYAARLERHESQIDWRRPATEIHNQIRGLQPWPLAAGLLGGRRLLLLKSDADPHAASHAPPATIVSTTDDAISVAAGAGVVRIRELQPEGRARMTVAAFLNGTRVATGSRFDPLPGPTP